MIEAKSNLRMQTAILLILIPTVMILTMIVGWIVYSDLRMSILDGFDHKLHAVSTVTAAFIDGNKHEKLENLRQVRGLAYDFDRKLLYGSCPARNTIIQLNTRHGRVVELGPFDYELTADLAFNPDTGQIYTTAANGCFLAIDPQDQTVDSVLLDSLVCYGMTYDSTQNRVLATGYTHPGVDHTDPATPESNLQLIHIDPETGMSTAIGSVGWEKVYSLAFDASTRQVFGFDIQTKSLVVIDPNTGVGTRSLKISWRHPDYRQNKLSANTGPLILAPLGLTYDPEQSMLIGSTTLPLITVHPDIGLAVTYQWSINRPEVEQTYLDYVYPMIRIRELSDLTFLYTFILDNRYSRNQQQIVYMLDSTQDEKHSYVGSRDPEDVDESILDVWLKDEVYISDIADWADWGMLKSAYAPILNDMGKVSGITGADVDITVIEKKLNQATLSVLLIGCFSLLLGVLVSIQISRKLIRPIGQLKEIALRVASGQYGQEIQIDRPQELAELALAFNDMSQSLSRTIANMNRLNQELEEKRQRQELLRLLARKIDLRKFEDSNQVWHGYLFDEHYSFNASSWLCKPNTFTLWMCHSLEDPFWSVKYKNDYFESLHRFYELHGYDWAAFRDFAAQIHPDILYALVRYELKTQQIHYFCRQEIKAYLFDGIAWQVISIDGQGQLHLKFGQVIVISSYDLSRLNIASIRPVYPDHEKKARQILAEINDLAVQNNATKTDSDDGIIAVMVYSL